MFEIFCSYCGRPITDKKQEMGGLWLHLPRSIVSHHYHGECAEKVHEAIEACCKQGKREGAEDVETRVENR